jgi:hypothetical protein
LSLEKCGSRGVIFSHMLLTYLDDSSEQGLFLLAPVVIRDEAWLRTLDASSASLDTLPQRWS